MCVCVNVGVNRWFWCEI